MVSNFVVRLVSKIRFARLTMFTVKAVFVVARTNAVSDF